MQGVRKFLGKLPTGLLSGLTVIAILWLTLAPKPLGDEPPPLFPGADKIAHAIMFGELTWMILLDWQRKHAWEKVKMSTILIVAFSSSLFGILIEFLQAAMQLGRGFEYADMAADLIGSFICVFIYKYFQNFWVSTTDK